MKRLLTKKPLTLVLSFLLLTIFLTIPSNAQEKAKSHVKLTWQEFRQLLKLDSNEITLSWQEFKQLLAQTGEKINVPYTVKNGKVILSRQQFKQLLDKMKPPHLTLANPPADYVISKGEYQGKMSKQGTAITATFAVEIFDRGKTRYQQIPILPRSVALAKVLLDQKQVLVMEKNGWYCITTTEIGHHSIQATFYTSSSLDKGPTIFSQSIIKTAITLLQMDIPLQKVDISVVNAKEMQISQKDGSTRVRAVLPASNSISIQALRKYKPTDDPAKKIPAKIYGETINLLSIEEDAVRVNSRIKLNILQSRINQIKLHMPRNYNILTINKANGTRMRHWQVDENGEDKVLQVTFDAQVEGTFVFNILTEQLLKGKQTEVEFAGFKIEGAVRETGFIGAEKKSTAEAVPDDSTNLDRLDIKDLPYELVRMSSRPLLFGFRYLRHPYHLAMTITRHEELPTISTVIDMASVISVVLDDGKMLTKVNYQIRNTWKQFLKLDLPGDAEVWTVYVNSKQENASRSKDNKIMIPLVRSKSTNDVLQSFSIDLIYFSKGYPLSTWGKNSIQFPTADILTSKMIWSVYLPNKYRYLSFSGNVEKEKMASTLNLILGKSRRFSLDQVSSYSEVAENLERAPQKQGEMNKYQQSLQSSFKNQAINRRDLARQIRQEAAFNMEVQKEQTKSVGRPGSGSNIFKIELPTSGQIFRFNKTVIEGELIEINYFYAASFVVTLMRILLLLIVLTILFLLRKKILGLVKRIYNKVLGWKSLWNLLNTSHGLRLSLFLSLVIFFFISHILFIILAILFIISIFRPDWLLREIDLKKSSSTDQKESK